jgi:hypothetical protein
MRTPSKPAAKLERKITNRTIPVRKGEEQRLTSAAPPLKLPTVVLGAVPSAEEIRIRLARLEEHERWV